MRISEVDGDRQPFAGASRATSRRLAAMGGRDPLTPSQIRIPCKVNFLRALSEEDT
jgi:hypothetical protein